MKKPGQVNVEVPEDDSPAWGKVGLIAVVGFVVGVAWPKLTGIKLGPNAPTEAASAPAAASQRAPDAPHEVALSAATVQQGKPAASQAAPGGSAAPPAAKPAGNVVTVGHGAVISCKTADGEKKAGKECGVSGFDGVAMPRLQNLGQCTAAATATGKLSAVFTLDYAGGRMDMSIGKSSTVKEPDAFLTCMRTELNGVVLKGIPHEHPRYVVAYSVSFEPGKDAKPEPAAANAPAPKDDGKGSSAQVTWETALVRDQPKTGAVVARLPRGTKVTTTSSRDGWYKVSCPEGEGWVYRGAIGR